jgi:hypothetical protein
VFEGREEDNIYTADLIEALAAMEESPWGEWWWDFGADKPTQPAPRKLAKLLRPYGPKPDSVRIGETHKRGYRREDFLDPWTRFLPSPEEAGHPGQAGHPSIHTGKSVPDAVPDVPGHVPDTAAQIPLEQTDVPDVPDVPDISGIERERFCEGCRSHDDCAARGSCHWIESL